MGSGRVIFSVRAVLLLVDVFQWPNEISLVPRHLSSLHPVVAARCWHSFATRPPAVERPAAQPTPTNLVADGILRKHRYWTCGRSRLHPLSRRLFRSGFSGSMGQGTIFSASTLTCLGPEFLCFVEADHPFRNPYFSVFCRSPWRNKKHFGLLQISEFMHVVK